MNDLNTKIDPLLCKSFQDFICSIFTIHEVVVTPGSAWVGMLTQYSLTLTSDLYDIAAEPLAMK